MQQKIDPVRLEVIRNSIIRIAEQMGATIQRTAHSPVIYEGLDFVCGILDADRNLVGGTSGITAFLGNLPAALEDIDNIIGFKNLEEGDIVFCNDPYFGGGTHGNDIASFYPLFEDNKLYGFTAFKGHTLDMGGTYAGGYYNNTTEIFSELFRVVPVKLYRRGVLNEDILRLVRANSRTPDYAEGDIRAMVAAVKIGAQRVKELVRQYGFDQFQLYKNEILDHSERITREQIKQIAEGEYSAEYMLDGDGDDGQPHSTNLKVHLHLTVKNGEIYVDMSDSSPQSTGSLNCTRASSISFIRTGFKSITTPLIPLNDGCFRPLHIKLKPGTVLDPIPPAAASLWVEVGQSIPDLFNKALAGTIPNRVRASNFGSDVCDFVYGTDPRTGRFYVNAETAAPGGWGATSTRDGVSLFAIIEGDAYYPMCEIFETLYPYLVEKFAFIQNSGGPGKYRGGLGVERIIIPLNHDANLITAFERQKNTKPWGLFGGKEGHANFVQIIRKDGTIEPHEKVTNLPIKAGEKIILQTGGGGGYGDPKTREPEKVHSDVLREYVSVKAAKEQYGVIVNPTTMTLDQTATATYRKSTTKP